MNKTECKLLISILKTILSYLNSGNVEKLKDFIETLIKEYEG